MGFAASAGVLPNLSGAGVAAGQEITSERMGFAASAGVLPNLSGAGVAAGQEITSGSTQVGPGKETFKGEGSE
ncbi:9870_t:CDS:2 [Cetraspora pellucida]|uniref:9870_t:CDS:1 n=1 Tax=Cetraspora pellucida TaxID=1433469 RepID=A0ACA9LSI5_9GLOM|nr:9870_t:CDS:2 [Cetraspora pellucida]